MGNRRGAVIPDFYAKTKYSSLAWRLLSNILPLDHKAKVITPLSTKTIHQSKASQQLI
jgi:hypothetical protein